MQHEALGDALRELVLRSLGFSQSPAADLDGLRALYGAWCHRVPFDNVRKMIALRAGDHRPLPGGTAVDFFEAWLGRGTGGTCWPTSNALFELVRSLGFEACRIAGSMRDLGIVNHASVKVTIGAAGWLVDSSLLCNVPLPLRDELFILDDPVFAAEVEPDRQAYVVWSHTPPNSSYLPCRFFGDRVTHAYYLARYEESRARSPFNQRLYARRNRPGEMVVLVGSTRFSKTVTGVETRELSRDGLRESLHRDIGLSEEVIDEWVRAGGLSASFEPPSGPKPLPVTRKPPSLR